MKLLCLLALEGTSLLVSEIAKVILYRLSDEAMDELGITPVTPGKSSNKLKALQQERTQVYNRAWSAFHRVVDLLDAWPITTLGIEGVNRHRFLTNEEWAQVLAARDPEDCARKKQRLDWFCNKLLETTHRMIPRAARRHWKGDSCIDATVVSAHGQRRAKKTAGVSKHVSIEPDFGWYKRDGEHGVPLEPAKPSTEIGKAKAKGKDKLIWGGEAHLEVMVPIPGRPGLYPLMVVAMSFDTPGHDIAGNALIGYQSLADRGHPAGMVAGDLAYFPNSVPSKLQLPMRALHHTLCFDYRDDQLGIMATFGGAILVEGWWYCPSMPQSLIDASKDFRAGLIDDETYVKRIAQRRRYALRIKEGPDDDGYYRLVCPAEDLSATAPATVNCLKLKPAEHPAGKTTIRAIPDDLGPICKQHSVVFPAVEAAKYRQELQYQSPEWRAFYPLARAVIEGYNGFIKDGNEEALHEATRRRVRGRAATQLFCAFLVVSANLRKLAMWYLEREIEVIDEGAPKRRARRRSDTLADHRPDVVIPAAQDPPDAA